MIILIISAIFFAIGCILWADAKPNSMTNLIGILFMVFSLVFGFFLLGLVYPNKEQTNIIVPENVAKSEFVVFAKIDGITISENDAKIVAAPVNSIRVKKDSSYNSYGFCISDRYSIILSD